MLLELCVTELEDVATDSQSGRLSSQPVVVESSHPYTDDTSTSGTVKIPGKTGQSPRGDCRQTFALRKTQSQQGFFFVCVFACFLSGAEGLRIEFDRQCSTERRHDPLTIMDGANRIVSVRSGENRDSVISSVVSW